MSANLRWYLCVKVYDIKGEFCKILVELENNNNNKDKKSDNVSI